MKKKFRVYAVIEQDLYVDIEAESEEEALEIAENMDGGDFEQDTGGDFRITYADEI